MVNFLKKCLQLNCASTGTEVRLNTPTLTDTEGYTYFSYFFRGRDTGLTNNYPYVDYSNYNSSSGFGFSGFSTVDMIYNILYYRVSPQQIWFPTTASSNMRNKRYPYSQWMHVYGRIRPRLEAGTEFGINYGLYSKRGFNTNSSSTNVRPTWLSFINQSSAAWGTMELANLWVHESTTEVFPDILEFKDNFIDIETGGAIEIDGDGTIDGATPLIYLKCEGDNPLANSGSGSDLTFNSVSPGGARYYIKSAGANVRIGRHFDLGSPPKESSKIALYNSVDQSPIDASSRVRPSTKFFFISKHYFAGFTCGTQRYIANAIENCYVDASNFIYVQIRGADGDAYAGMRFQFDGDVPPEFLETPATIKGSTAILYIDANGGSPVGYAIASGVVHELTGSIVSATGTVAYTYSTIAHIAGYEGFMYDEQIINENPSTPWDDAEAMRNLLYGDDVVLKPHGIYGEELLGIKPISSKSRYQGPQCPNLGYTQGSVVTNVSSLIVQGYRGSKAKLQHLTPSLKEDPVAKAEIERKLAL